MSNDDYFRRQASEAQQHADRSISDVDRASWLRIAQSWLGLIRGRTRSGREEFDDATKQRGPGKTCQKTRNSPVVRSMKCTKRV